MISAFGTPVAIRGGWGPCGKPSRHDAFMRANLRKNLVGHWKVLGTSTAQLLDHSGRGNHMGSAGSSHEEGSGPIYPTSQHGTRGGIVRNGDGDFLITTQSFTAVWWIWPDASTDGIEHGMFGKWAHTSAARSFGVYCTTTSANDVQFAISADGAAPASGNIVTATFVAQSMWHLVVAMYDRNQNELSIEVLPQYGGTGSRASATVTIDCYSTTVSLMYGANLNWSNTYAYQCVVGPCSFWTRALTRAEIAWLWNHGRGNILI